MITIREATLEDLPGLLELGREGVAESRFSALTFDPEHYTESLRGVILSEKNTHCLLLAVNAEGAPVGALLGALERYFFAAERVAGALGLYVTPASRGGPAAVKLITAFRRWALNRGAAELSIGVTSGLDLKRTDRFLRRLGFRASGANYVLRLST